VRAEPFGPVIDVGVELGDGMTHFRVHRVSLLFEKAE